MTILWTIFLAITANHSLVSDAPSTLTHCVGPVLRSSTLPRDAADGTIVLHIPDPGTLDLGDALTLSAIRQLDGSCAMLVQRSIGGEDRSNSLTVVCSCLLPSQASTFSRTRPNDLLPMHLTAAPPLKNRCRCFAGRACSSALGWTFERVEEHFVGVWRVGKKWLVRSFTQREDRSFTKPRPVLTSRLPVRSLTYLASRDTPSGRLEIVQQQRDGRARSIVFDWWHSFAFKQR